ncbi:MAG: CRISPR-associated helicase Cas3' [Clostridium sulfidigenes]|uniref:CRISPR-associated helicase Cas3 n=1 Tax=Clostridium sulfidigenes TaxID=318464 RepID=A0A927W938_9CLOT|nr:CRISPR-associated helicase Cas3' [Clostridium sulfidigenes]
MAYFNSCNLIEISSLINDKYIFYAHLKEEKKETLKEHTDLVNKYLKKIVNAKNIDKIFENYEENCLEDLSEEGKKVFRKLLINTFNFHDIGKINPNFQLRKMTNDIGNTNMFQDVHSKHSILSAILYIDYFISDVEKLDRVSKNIIIEYLFLNAYVISRHHGGLDSFEKFLDRFLEESGDEAEACVEIFSNNNIDFYKREYKMVIKKFKGIIKFLKGKMDKKDEENSINIYIYVKLVFSLLVGSDFYATSEFMSGTKLENFGEIYGIDEFYNRYKETEVYNSIRSYENNRYEKSKDLLKERNINVLRTEMFLDAERELIKNIDNNIFFLEAPTGSGKSNVSLNLSFKLLEDRNSLRKIYYVYPFNTLVEQNKISMEKIFGKESEITNKVAVINSITPVKMEEKIMDDKDEDGKIEYYSKALLNRQFLNYPMILTTHVSLFNTMFNSSKESSFAFHQLANSVVVLDEIQSYKNIIWSEIITFLKGFAKILNMKVIIMSATLPDLNYLTGSSANTCNLIKDREKYFSNPLFKNRVTVDYELMDKGFDEIYSHVKNKSLEGNKILVEFIKKKSAYDFYNRLKDDEEIQSKVELISGDDNAIERKRILELVTKTPNIILVATQVIEAGVDIDMDIGYKDISKLDSDEQFMGRINRSCKKDGIVYFFNYDETKGIYKDDVRVNKDYSLLNDEMKEILVNKNFSEYYKPVLKGIREQYNETFSDSNLENFFKNEVGKLNFPKIEKRMELICDDMWSLSVFIARELETQSKTTLNGREIWESYRELLRDNSLKYAEKEVRLSEIRALLNYFIYQVKKSDILYNDRLGELYYIEDGEKYFKDGKIDKEKLTTGIGDFI